MHVILNNCWAEVVTATADELRRFTQVMTYQDTNSLFEFDYKTKKQVRKRKRDLSGKIVYRRDLAGGLLLDDKGEPIPELEPLRMMSMIRDEKFFPAGLLGYLAADFKSVGLALSFVDKRPTPPQAHPELVDAFFMEIVKRGGELRPYQIAAAKAALTAGRGILQLATGAGKTNTAMSIVGAVPEGKWLFITPSIDLLKNATAAYAKAFPGETAGKIHQGKASIRNFTVSTFQTLYAQMENPTVKHYLEKVVTGVIIDEGHKIGAATQYEVVMACKSAYYRLSLSATPLDRSDNKNLYNIGATGRVLTSVSAKRLIDEDVLAKVQIIMHTVVQGDQRKMSMHDAYKQFIVQSAVRMAKLVQVAKVVPNPGLIFCIQEDHGKRITQALLAEGIKAKFIWGKTNSAGRDEAVKELLAGKYDFLVVSTIFDTGIDIPELRSAIAAGGRKAVIAALQRLGRVLRKDHASGKHSVEFHDFLDQNPPGLKDSSNAINAKHALARRATYVKNQHPVTIQP